MAEETGLVNENLEAVLSIKLVNGSLIDCVLDTGFNGFLLLPRRFIEENSLEIVGTESIMMVEYHTAEVAIASGTIVWMGTKRAVLILVSENDESLIGTQMLIDSKLEIDYKNISVRIAG